MRPLECEPAYRTTTARKCSYVAAPEGGGIAICDYAFWRVGTIDQGLGQYTEGVALSPVAQL